MSYFLRTFYLELFTMNYLLRTIYYELFTTTYLLRSIYYELFTMSYLLRTIYSELFTIFRPCRFFYIQDVDFSLLLAVHGITIRLPRHVHGEQVDPLQSSTQTSLK